MTDDLRRKRSRGNHLTEAEVAKARALYQAGRLVEDIADQLNCSLRAVYRNTRDLRANGTVARRKPSIWREPRTRSEPVSAAPPARASRFYKSEFVPS